MKTRWSIISVGLVTLSLLSAITAYGRPEAGRGGHRFGPGGVGFPAYVLKAVNLTTEQQTQIQAIKEAHQQTAETLRNELRSINDAVTKKFLASGDLTAENFTNEAERIATLEAQLFKERIAIGLEVRKVLTPDQLAKAAEIVAKQQELHAEQKSLLKTD